MMGQTLSGADIYANFHSKSSGTGSLSDSQAAGLRMASRYQDRAVAVQKLIDGIKSGWTGDAADAASQGLTPLAENSLQTGQDLNSAQDLMYRQADSWHTAAAKVQPMPPEPQMQNVIMAAANNQPIQPMLNQIQSYNAAAQNNVDAYTAYTNESHFNATGTPDVSSTMATQGAPVAAIRPSASTAGQPVGSTTSAPFVRGVTGDDVRARAISASDRTSLVTEPSPIVGGSSPVPVGGTGNPVGPIAGQTSTSGTTTPVVPGGAPPSTGVVPPGGSSGSTSPGDPVEYPIGGTGGWPGDGELGPGGSNSITSRLGGGSSLVDEGPGAGSGAGPGGRAGLGTGLPEDGPGSGAGLGSRAGGMASGGQAGVPGRSGAGGAAPEDGDGSGARSGVGGTAEEDALASERSLSKPVGQAGAMGGPIGAGRGGQRQDDGEHKRKYEYGDDPDELYTGTDKVMPPVIGESESERKARYNRDAER